MICLSAGIILLFTLCSLVLCHIMIENNLSTWYALVGKSILPESFAVTKL